MAASLRVAVVGGGIAGLALAATLDPRRFDVDLYEAEPDRAHLGAPLGLWPAARRALAAIGVAPPVESTGPARLHSIRGTAISPAGHAPIGLVARPALLAALDAAVPASVRRDHREVSDPASLDADLVVGADGVRSSVRPLVSARAAKRVETPYVALRGMRPAATEPGDAGEYWGRGLLFGLVPFGPEQDYWFTTHRSDIGAEPIDPAQLVEEARERFAAAAPVIRVVLAAAGPDTLATRIWVVPPMRRYLNGRYIVVGDAAHATTPNLGRGACDAVLDAVSLGAALNAESDLRRWQAKRVAATQAARVAARGLMSLATGPLLGRPR